MHYYNYIEIVIYFLIFILIYTFALYPVLLYFFSGIFGKSVKASESYRPDISVVISAYNEEKHIGDALESVYASDYPADKLNVYVGSDGSDDRTSEIVRSLTGKYNNLFFYEYPRGGKNNVLNNIMPETKTEIIIYMDADVRIQPDSISHLVNKLADPEVGTVMSKLNMINSAGNENAGRLGETLYQSYESMVRTYESKIKSTVNNMGALYGMKRSIYRPIPNNYVCDDMYNVLISNVERKRVIFDSETYVDEVREKSLGAELNRRVRMVAGGLSTVWACKKLLNPLYGWPSFFLVSHKILRWATPLVMILILAASIILPPESQIKMPLIYIQAAFYLAAFLGWLLEKLKIRFVLFRIPLFFVSMNIGFLLGILRFIKGGQNASWEKL